MDVGKGNEVLCANVSSLHSTPQNSKVEMDKEDTTQNIEQRQAVGSEHHPFFSGHVPCTTSDFLNWK